MCCRSEQPLLNQIIQRRLVLEQVEFGRFFSSNIHPHSTIYYQSIMKSLPLLTTLLLVVSVLSLPKQAPIIGIYTQSDASDQPVSSLRTQKRDVLKSSFSYIAASYVKYIQMSGAQVVPIFAYSSTAYLDNLLPKLNGVLFPGGDTDLNINTTWTKNADYILKYGMEQNRKGNVFPIWGTCLGMQLLAYLTSGYDGAAIAPVNGQVAIRNTIQIQPSSVLYSGVSQDLKYHLENGKGVIYFNHHFAVRREYFEKSRLLRDFWDVQSYTTTSFNEDFLSTFKAKDYPFFGVQFHPQKNLFEWKVFADRSNWGVQIVQILSNKFVEYARQSKNSFADPEQFRRLSIYNYKTQFTNQSFIQIYLFNEVNSYRQLFRTRGESNVKRSALRAQPQLLVRAQPQLLVRAQPQLLVSA